jgi:hypothetical protein
MFPPFGLPSLYWLQSGMAWSILELGAQVFYTGRRAADGKIYYSVFGSNGFTLSVIHEPDKKGLDCNVEQHGIILSSLTEGTLPFFPNYRLGPLKGSSCDTIITSSHEYIKQENYFVDANSILRSNAWNPTEKTTTGNHQLRRKNSKQRINLFST